MSETPTGTDHDELTDAEFIPLCGTAGLRFWQSPEATRLREGIDRLVADRTAQLRKAYNTVNTENEESAARVQAYAAERDDARFFAEKFKAALHNATDRDREHMEKIAAERDAARAELAAANDRISELEAALPKRTNDWLAHCKRLDAERDAVSDDLCKAWKELGEVEAENAALQATLDRVTALADEWEREAKSWTEQAEACYEGTESRSKRLALASKYSTQAAKIRAAIDGPGDSTTRRAALTPEGKPMCGNCGHPKHRAECYDCIRYDLREVCGTKDGDDDE